MAPYTGPDGVPGALDYMSFSTALYGESDLWTLCCQLSWLGTTSLPALITATSSNCPPAPLLSFCFQFFFFFLNYVSGLIFIFIFYHCPHCPPPSTSSPLPHLLSPLYLLFTPYSSSPGLQRGRENFFLVFLFLFSCCNCFFFIKMNKVNIFYYTEQIRYFSSSDLKKRQNCNKENCYTFICYSLFTAGRMLWMNEHI